MVSYLLTREKDLVEGKYGGHGIEYLTTSNAGILHCGFKDPSPVAQG